MALVHLLLLPTHFLLSWASPTSNICLDSIILLPKNRSVKQGGWVERVQLSGLKGYGPRAERTVRLPELLGPAPKLLGASDAPGDGVLGTAVIRSVNIGRVVVV